MKKTNVFFAGEKIGLTRVIVDGKKINGQIKTKCTVCGGEHMTDYSVLHDRPFGTCTCATIQKRADTMHKKTEYKNPMNMLLRKAWR